MPAYGRCATKKRKKPTTDSKDSKVSNPFKVKTRTSVPYIYRMQLYNDYKYITYQLGPGDINSLMQNETHTLFKIGQGTKFQQRIGEEITIRHIELSYVIGIRSVSNTNNNSRPPAIGLRLFLDKQNNGATGLGAVQAVYGPSMTTVAYQNDCAAFYPQAFTSKSRYYTLWASKPICCIGSYLPNEDPSATSSSVMSGEIHIDCCIPVQYANAGVDPITNALYMYAGSNENNDIWRYDFQWCVNVYYEDTTN